MTVASELRFERSIVSNVSLTGCWCGARASRQPPAVPIEPCVNNGIKFDFLPGPRINYLSRFQYTEVSWQESYVHRFTLPVPSGSASGDIAALPPSPLVCLARLLPVVTQTKFAGRLADSPSQTPSPKASLGSMALGMCVNVSVKYRCVTDAECQRCIQSVHGMSAHVCTRFSIVRTHMLA